MNIDDILNMSVDEAMDFFGSQEEPVARRIAEHLQPLVDVGLSYIKLGQSSSTLSGGESQRIKLAYFLSLTDAGVRNKPQRILFIFDEPTRGIDVNSKAEIYTLMGELLKEGKAILMISSDMPELISMSDRVIIVKDGAITGELDGQNINEQNIITQAV